MPDRILIEARNRLNDNIDDQTVPAASSRSQIPRDESSNDEGDDDDDDDDDDEADGEDEDEEEAEVRPADHSPANATTKGKGKKPRKEVARVKVTESDLREMAKYWAERDASWDSYRSVSARWAEFAKIVRTLAKRSPVKAVSFNSLRFCRIRKGR